MSRRPAFAAGYDEARATFLSRARERGTIISRTLEDVSGPDGEPLATDAVLIGAQEAERLLILVSGTHGVEGFAGSGVQTALLNAGWRPPAGIAMLMIHALNPFGFAHLRRTNETNVDLNRNFLDHGAPHPPNPAYDEVHPLLVPPDWDGPARAAADAALADYAATRGARTLQAATCGGQWDHPDGLFYGGRAPAWSNGTWHGLLARFAGTARLVAAIDVHTGLGPRAACELISGAVAGSDEHRLAQRWFGSNIVFPGLSSTAPAAQGFMGATLATALPQARGALVVAEYGTVAFARVLEALRADNWLWAKGDDAARRDRHHRAAMRDAFHGDADWQDAIMHHARSLVDTAAAALAATPCT